MCVCLCAFFKGGGGIRGGWGWGLVGSSYLLAQGKCVP